MKKLTKTQKNIVKWIFVVALIGILIYTFRDIALPIGKQIMKTRLNILFLIILATLLYGIFESIITFFMARKYNRGFRFSYAIEMTYFCSFYRTATLGSGAGVAAIIYMSKRGMKGSEACGMYTLEYALHKMSIALMAVGLFLGNWSYMKVEFASYKGYLILGIVATIVITACLMLFACAAWFHKFLYKLMDWVNFKGKFTERFQQIREQCEIMEAASKKILTDWKTVVFVVVMNFIKLSCWFIIPYIILVYTGNVTPGMTLAVTAVSVMLAAVIPTPAGIGSSEFVLIGMFGGIVGQAEAGAMALLYRFATFVFPCLLGAFVAAGYAAASGKNKSGIGNDNGKEVEHRERKKGQKSVGQRAQER